MNYLNAGLALVFSTLTLSVCVPLNLNAQVEGFTWFNALQSGEGRSDEIKRIRTAANGDVLVCGEFRGVKDFDPGEGKLLKTTSGQNTANPFVARYTAAGEPVWVRQLRAASTCEVNGMDVDADGNIYLVGYFNSLFYPDESNPEVVLVNNPEPNADMWMVSYTSNGEYRWGQMLGGASVDNLRAVSISGNRMIVGGHFSQTVDLDPGPGVFEVATGGGSGQVPFIASYDKDNGSFQWGFDIGGSIGFNRINDMCIDDEGNIYATGAFRLTKDFNPDPENEFLLTSQGNDDMFVASYTPEGSFRWANRGGSTSADTGLGVHWNNGTLFLTGEFRTTSNFSGGAEPVILVSAGNLDMFLATYEGFTGELLDVFGVGGAGNDSGEGIATDADGNVVVVGYFSDAVNFAPNDNEAVLATGTAATGFMASYTELGALNWVTDVQSEGQIRYSGMALHGSELRAVGRYSVSTDFDPSENEFILTSASNTNTNLFYSSYQQATGSFNTAFTCEDQVGGICETTALANRASGGVAATGTFIGTLHFPSGGSLFAASGQNAFVCTMDEAGELLQTAMLDASGDAIARDLIVDDEGSLYFIASFQGTGSFEAPNASIALGPTGNQARMLLVKMNEDLEVIWHQTYTGSSLQTPISIASHNDHIALTGNFQGTTEFSTEWSVTSNGNNDIFLVLLDKDGAVQWAYGFGSTGVDNAGSVGFDAEGNVLMGSSLRFTVNLDPAGQADPFAAGGTNRTAFSSYTIEGNYRWGYLHGQGNVIRSFAAIDENRFAAYGQFTDGFFGTDDEPVVLTSAGQADIYLAVYQNSGVLDTVFVLVGGPLNEEAWQMSTREGVIHFCGFARNGATFAYAQSVVLEAQFGQGFFGSLDLSQESLAVTIVPGQSGTATIKAFAMDGEDVRVGGRFSGLLGNIQVFASADAFVGLLGEFEIVEPTPCPGDFDGDGIVTAADLLLLLTAFGCQVDCAYDINGDGSTGVNDVLLFLSLFGTVCP